MTDPLKRRTDPFAKGAFVYPVAGSIHLRGEPKVTPKALLGVSVDTSQLPGGKDSWQVKAEVRAADGTTAVVPLTKNGHIKDVSSNRELDQFSAQAPQNAVFENIAGFQFIATSGDKVVKSEVYPADMIVDSEAGKAVF